MQSSQPQSTDRIDFIPAMQAANNIKEYFYKLEDYLYSEEIVLTAKQQAALTALSRRFLTNTSFGDTSLKVEASIAGMLIHIGMFLEELPNNVRISILPNKNNQFYQFKFFSLFRDFDQVKRVFDLILKYDKGNIKLKVSTDEELSFNEIYELLRQADQISASRILLPNLLKPYAYGIAGLIQNLKLQSQSKALSRNTPPE